MQDLIDKLAVEVLARDQELVDAILAYLSDACSPDAICTSLRLFNLILSVGTLLDKHHNVVNVLLAHRLDLGLRLLRLSNQLINLVTVNGLCQLEKQIGPLQKKVTKQQCVLLLRVIRWLLFGLIFLGL
jgi:small basic protein